MVVGERQLPGTPTRSTKEHQSEVTHT